MRPSSSPSEGGLFSGVLGRGGSAVDDRAWLQALLDAEAGLARAQAAVGLLPWEHAEAISSACDASRFDVATIGREAASGGNPVIPLVRHLTAAVPGDAAGQVHRGATSQDIVDTAAMLVAHRALGPLLEDARAAAEAAARLARAHRSTVMAGRTLLQQAVPVTFGLTAAGWMSAVDAAVRRLTEVRSTRLAVQLGGAAGTLASLGTDGIAVAEAYAGALGLAAPVLPWHTDRTRVAELASALGTLAGVVTKIGRDVVLLAQTEVGEVAEGSPGGSSAMPHKQNPVAAVSAVAAGLRAPGLVSTVLTAMAQEHQRGAGPWHAEWLPLRDLLTATGSAVAWLRDCLENLTVDAARMRSNLDLTGGLVLAERVTAALAPRLGRLAAHDLVSSAAGGGRPFADALAGAGLPADEVAALLDPASYLGSAEAFVDRALAAHAGTGP